MVNWIEILIKCEIDTVNFYAEEIGFFKKFSEKLENEEIQQRIKFFITYSEIEMENANDRLKEYRQNLEALEPVA